MVEEYSPVYEAPEEKNSKPTLDNSRYFFDHTLLPVSRCSWRGMVVMG